MRKIFAIPVVIATVLGCSDHPNQKQITQVDSLMTIVTSAEKTMSDLNPDEFAKILDTVKQDVSFIQSHYPDTMDLPIALKIDYYYRTLKSVRKFKETFKSQKSELTYTNQQLSNLKQDLDNEVLKVDDFKELFPLEAQAVERHNESVSNIKVWHESIGSTYSRHKPGIDSIITYIKTNSSN